MKNLRSKKVAFFAVLGLFVMTFGACQREGCPGMITQDTAKPAVEECM